MKMFIFVLWNMFIFCIQPMQKIFILFFMLITLSFFYTYFLKNSWLVLMFCILILSGLMIIFIYMSSLKKKMFKYKMYYMNFVYLSMFLMFNYMNETYNFMEMKFFFIKENIFMNIFIDWNNSFLMLLLILLLLILLLMFMELLFNLKSSFRSIN